MNVCTLTVVAADAAGCRKTHAALGGNLDNPLQPFSQVDSREGLDQVHKDLERLPIEGRLKGRPFLLGRDY